MAAASHRGNGPTILLIGVIAALAIVIVYFLINPPVCTIHVNGKELTVATNTTMKKLIDDGYADPKAGNLIAVDGTVAKAGEGNPFDAYIDGELTHDPGEKVKRDATISIEDGSDIEEAYTSTTSVAPYASGIASPTLSNYFNGSIHLFSEGVDGEKEERTGEISGKSIVTITKQPIASGFSAGHADVGDDKVIALTFDDGPWPDTTAEILEILEENGAHATFFTVGEQVSTYADTLKKVHAAGNQIATHTYDHAEGAGQGVDLTLMSKDQQIQEVVKGFDAIEDVLGVKVSPIFRAPGGNYYGKLVETLSPYVDAEIGWDIDTQDWKRPGVDVIVERILSAEPGDIILCHDGGGERSQTVEAIRDAVPELVNRGYKLVTIDELLEYGVRAS